MKEFNFFKRALKNKIRITRSLFVFFLITGGVSYGQVNEGAEKSTVTVTEQDFENKGTINVKEGNAVKIEAPSNITNSGLISGFASLYTESSDATATAYANATATATATANGIVSYNDSSSSIGDIGDITNSGLISGFASLHAGSSDATANATAYANATATANGIVSYNDSSSSIGDIGDITNSGLISGFASLHAGSATTTTTTSASASAYANESVSANGIVSYNVSSSSIGDITNSGLISGFASLHAGSATTTTTTYATANAYAYANATATANGIVSYSYSNNSSSIGDITNSGLISGFASLHAGSATTTTTTTAYATATATATANGIVSYSYSNNSSSIGDITNSGLISGYIYSLSGEANNKKDYVSLEFSGNGISVNDNISNKINNDGVIKGSTSAIAAAKSITNITNNGILAGREIFSNGEELHAFSSTKSEKPLGQISPVTEMNNGIYIKLESEISSDNSNHETGNVKVDTKGNPEIKEIKNGTGGVVTLEYGSNKTVINGELYDQNGSSTTISTSARDSYVISNGSYKDSIINGAGMKEGALVVDKETSVTNSIVNGYNTGIYLKNGNIFTATDTIINGGGLKNDIAVLRGDDNNNTANILGNSVINGKTDLGNGDDGLTIANTVQVNGDLNGGNGTDTLNLGEKTLSRADENLNILHNISGFESINTNGNVTLFETTKVSNANNINLESGNLVLRVNPTEVDGDGKIKGHALYENNGTLTSKGGNLVIGLNGLREDAIVSMGGTTIENSVNDSWWKDSDHLKTNSLVLDAKLENGGKDVKITLKESIPLEPSKPIVKPEPPKPEPPLTIDPLLYEKLNKVYQSIVSAGEIGKLANTTLLEDKTYNESLGGLLTILNQIYANTPYGYSLKMSRDSLKLFNDNMSYLTIKPKKGEYIAQGKAIYTGVKNDTSDSGKNYYGFDTGTNSYKTTTNTVGGIATLEYGLTDKTSLGLALGGNNQDVNFKGSSKIKGNSLYLGAFGKTEVDNFKFFGGIGYQYTSADADRSVYNKYDSFKTNEKYDINSFNAFIEGKYSYKLDEKITIEPKLKLSYYYITQEGVNEGYTPGSLSMKVAKENSSTADVEVGVDFVKESALKTGKLKGIFSVGMVNTLGEKENNLKGNILGMSKTGNEFEIQGTKLPTTSGKVGVNLEYEQTNGMIYTVGTEFEFAKDYNRNISVQVGVGYKF